MKSTLETLEGNKVKLSVEVEESEFDRDIEAAFRKIAREVRLPGFRPGKAPRRILEARIGIEAARQQALQDGIPTYLAKAVRDHSVDLIATPEVEVTGGEESGDIQFDATCEIRPTVDVPGYGGLRVELPAIEPTDEEIDAAGEAERRRHGNLQPADRAIESGDYVTLDLAATRNGEPVPGLNTDEWLYEVGKGWVAADFDEHLIGRSNGEELTFVSTPSGTSEEAEFSVKITNVQMLVLPEVTDEWVGEISDQTSVEAWRGALKDRLAVGKLNAARNVVLERTTSALAELVELDPPEALVNAELQQRVQNFVRQLQSQGIQVDQWLQATGQDPASFTEGLREGSAKAVKVDLALRSVATAEGLEVEDADVELEYERIAMRVGQKVKDVRKAYEKNDVVPELVAEIRKSKALEWLLHRVEMVDEAGNRLENDTVLGHSEHDHDGHDHDHDGHDHVAGDHDHDGQHEHGDEGDTE